MIKSSLEATVETLMHWLDSKVTPEATISEVICDGCGKANQMTVLNVGMDCSTSCTLECPTCNKHQGMASYGSNLKATQPAKIFPPPRILVVDDTAAIHNDFEKVLKPAQEMSASMAEMEALILGTQQPEKGQAYLIDHAMQGQQAFTMAVEAEQAGSPYALAFMDVRMPPGWDGIETIERIWRVCPYIEMVIVTAYSDHHPDEINRRIGATDRLFLVQKPFDGGVIRQLVRTLLKKWQLGFEARSNFALLEKDLGPKANQLAQILKEI